MDCLLLRFDAPLMSFGAVLIDEHNPTMRFPGTAQLAGMLGNALGWDHAHTDRLQALQDRLRFAARWDVRPEPLRDYQTVDLGQDFMLAGWTTRGKVEGRRGGNANKGTHIRLRDYWANGVLTLAISLDGAGAPCLADVQAALLQPARPLFIGRKPCLPAAPIFIGRRTASGVKAALAAEPLARRTGTRSPAPAQSSEPIRLEALWPLDEGADERSGAPTEERYDLRDWRNNIHRGSRRYAVGWLHLHTTAPQPEPQP